MKGIKSIFVVILMKLQGFISPLCHWLNARRAENILLELTSPVNLDNFQSPFNLDFNKRRLKGLIGIAIDAESVSWADLEIDPEGLDELLDEHLIGILAAYTQSFSADCWTTYDQTKRSYMAFIGLTHANEIPDTSIVRIKSLFCRKLYLLLVEEHFHTLDNGSVREMLARECAFTSSQIEGWCSDSKKSAITAARGPISA